MADVTTKNKGMFSAYLPEYNVMKQYNDPDNAFVRIGMPTHCEALGFND